MSATLDLAPPTPVGQDTLAWTEDVGKWKQLTNFTVSFEDDSDYWRPRQASRPMFADAVAKAAAFYAERGALAPITFADDAIEVRAYPRTARVAFLFKRSVAGQPLECAVEYQLTPDMVGWLKATRRWPEFDGRRPN